MQENILPFFQQLINQQQLKKIQKQLKQQQIAQKKELSKINNKLYEVIRKPTSGQYENYNLLKDKLSKLNKYDINYYNNVRDVINSIPKEKSNVYVDYFITNFEQKYPKILINKFDPELREYLSNNYKKKGFTKLSNDVIKKFNITNKLKNSI